MQKPDNSEHYTEPLCFVLIYSGDSVSRLDSLGGAHIHAIKESMLGTQPSLQPETVFSPPLNTILQHGTVLDLAAGRFDKGGTEAERLAKIGGDAGIASHAEPIGGKLTLNDEAIVVSGAGYLGTYEGGGRPLTPEDHYAFLQMFSLKGASTVQLEKADNVDHLVTQIQAQLGIGHGQSFAASFTGMLPKGHSTSRTIRGQDDGGKRYGTLRAAWAGWKVHDSKDQPLMSHVIDFEKGDGLEGLIITSPVQGVAIERFLIADSKGNEKLANGNSYRPAGDAVKEGKAATLIQSRIRRNLARFSFTERLKQERAKKENTAVKIMSRL